MVKFAYFSDTHFCSRKPIRRTDTNFFEAQISKLKSVTDFCIKQGVKVLLHGGDVFDTPHPDYGVLNAVATQLLRLKKRKIECYVTPGSHDLLGYRLGSVDKTSIGTLISTGLLKPLVGDMEIQSVLFYGVPAQLNHTLDVYKDIPDKRIIITHNIVTSDAVEYDHLTFEDLATTEFSRIFLCAHYHKFFKIQVGNTFFFNTGPLVRTSKIEAEHQPNLLIFDVDKGQTRFSTFLIPYVKDVLDLTEKTELGTICISGLKDTRIAFLDLFDLTKKLAEKHNIDKTIVDDALTRLDEARRSFSDV